MLLADAFTNYRQIMEDVTLSPAMGQYLDMGNNAMANPPRSRGQRKLRPRNHATVHYRHGHAEPGWHAPIGSNGIPVPTYLAVHCHRIRARLHRLDISRRCLARPLTGASTINPPGNMIP